MIPKNEDPKVLIDKLKKMVLGLQKSLAMKELQLKRAQHENRELKNQVAHLHYQVNKRG